MFALNTDLINKQREDSAKIYFAILLFGFGYITEARSHKSKNDSYYLNTGYAQELIKLSIMAPIKIWCYM
jgi:hypothetical protein